MLSLLKLHKLDKHINIMKMDMKQDKFINFCRLITNHQNVDNN
jgi:hypothetical protein